MSANTTTTPTVTTTPSLYNTDSRSAGSNFNHMGNTIRNDDAKINTNTNRDRDRDPSDDPDADLLDLLRQKFQSDDGLRSSTSKDTGVLSSASFICDNSIDVALDPRGTKAAAAQIWESMQQKGYDRSAWGKHDLHPSPQSLDTRGGDDREVVVVVNGQDEGDREEEEEEEEEDKERESPDISEKASELGDPSSRNENEENRWHPDAVLHLVFTIDLLNFSFWSEKSEEDRFAIEYRGKRWTGYMSLLAALRRALDEEIPITTPSFWRDENQLDAEKFKYVFRSMTGENIPLLTERLQILREAGAILKKTFNDSIASLISQSNQSAAMLVNTLAEHFPCFRDEFIFEERRVRFLKRAQIFVADLWAAFDGQGYGAFDDIDKITMFADYRIPQILHGMGCLLYSPPLESQIRGFLEIESGSSWEIQMRGCSIWCVEMIRREIVSQHPGAEVNAILIDFFLYDTMKEKEKAGDGDVIPHHRTRSIWY